MLVRSVLQQPNEFAQLLNGAQVVTVFLTHQFKGSTCEGLRARPMSQANATSSRLLIPQNAIYRFKFGLREAFEILLVHANVLIVVQLIQVAGEPPRFL